MLCQIMIRIQYFADFTGDVAVTMPDIKNSREPPTFFAFLGF